MVCASTGPGEDGATQRLHQLCSSRHSSMQRFRSATIGQESPAAVRGAVLLLVLRVNCTVTAVLAVGPACSMLVIVPFRSKGRGGHSRPNDPGVGGDYVTVQSVHLQVALMACHDRLRYGCAQASLLVSIECCFMVLFKLLLG